MGQALGAARRRGARVIATGLLSVGLLAGLLTEVDSASAVVYDTDENGALAMPVRSACPTLSSPPRSVEVWFNFDDMDVRGVFDPDNQTPWTFPQKIAQIICGARKNARIQIGMYFIRAIGTMTQPGLKAGPDPASSLGTRPESDPEVIYDALEYVTKYRNVKVGLVLDGGTITPASARALINKRLRSIAKIKGGIAWCKNGCFNINPTSVFPYAINHEKFVTISDTVWDGGSGAARPAAKARPAILSSSGNWARSQIRNYQQEETLIYNDRSMFAQIDARYRGMVNCARTGCRSNSGFPALLRRNTPVLDRGIWVDRLNPHGTDAGRGTTITFSPQPSTVVDPYIAAFSRVDCVVDKHVRVAMYKLTDSKAETMVSSLAALSRRGCNVKVLLTQDGGAYSITPAVVRALRAARIPATCTSVPMHTKVILIGPATGNEGRVISGTQNMSTSGLRYSEEHTLTFDVRRASAAYKDDLRLVYGDYLAGWYELSQTAKKCRA